MGKVCAVSAQAEDFDSIQNEYEAMVLNSYEMQSDYDFNRLRSLFKKLPTYKPYSLMPGFNYKKIKKASAEKPEKENEYFEKFIEKHFALPEAHEKGIAFAYKHKDKEKEAYHTWMFTGLMKSLISSGDGQRPDSAFQVLSVSEEYYLLHGRIKKGTKEQTLRHIGDGHYDIISGIDSKTGVSVEYWFNITDVFEKGLD